MIADEIDEISCASNTIGSFKDTCKISCNQECGGRKCIIFINWYRYDHNKRFLIFEDVN